MRYADGGGVDQTGRACREQVRHRAAVMFAQDVPVAQIAAELRVSTKSVYQWRRDWKAGGQQALASKGPPGTPPRLSAQQLEQLKEALDAGPAAAGFTDQRWTLARIVTLVKRMFGLAFSLKGMSLVLRRMRWTPQVPRHRAAQRDEQAIAKWRRYTWPAIKDQRAGWARGSALPTKPVRR